MPRREGYRAGEHPLDTIREKLKRADEHISTLQDEFEAFARTPLGVGFKVDFKTGWHTAYFDKGGRRPPSRLNVLAGESLYQARSSLEHLVWALVKANHKKPGKNNTFPLLKVPVGTKGLADKAAFIAMTKRKELAGVPMAAIALIEKLQPYNTGNRPDYVLTILNEMARDDRHREPLGSFIGGEPNALEPLFHPMRGARIVAFKTLLRENQSIVIGKTNVARLKIEPLSRQPKVNVKGDFPALIAFGNRQSMLTLPALHQVNVNVRQLLRLFEKFF